MAETILAWADLDTGISRLILLIFGIQDDAGSILIGNMDLKTKVEKIKMLHAHHSYSKATEGFTTLITSMKHYSDCRNIVAHRKCVGRLVSEPTRLAFLSAKHIKKTPGQFEIVCVDHSELVESAEFARDTALNIGAMITAIETRNKNSPDG